MQIQFIGCAAANFRKGRLAPYRPEAIVIHIMAGSLLGTDSWFANPAAGVSAHYGIGRNGQIHQYVREEDTAFHAGTVDRPLWQTIKRTAAGVIVNPNHYTIGIEHEGRETDVWTDSMCGTSGELIAAISARWGIPVDRAHIVKHHEIRFAKPCPGDTAPMDRLIALAAGGAAPAPVPPALTQVTTMMTLKIRVGAPNTFVPIRRVVPAGATLQVAGFTASGESVAANPNWYRDPSGDFFWAGGTDRPHPAISPA
jgi:N-acetylmuramoyl-L-alanine amidase